MFATDIFGCGIHVELVNISPLTWTLTPKALLSLRFAMNIFAHGIDVELVNIVPPPPDMVSDTKGLAITYVWNVFGHGIDVELVNIVPLSQHGPLLTWLPPDMDFDIKGLAITYVWNILGHGIDVELVNTVSPPPGMVSDTQEPCYHLCLQ